MSAVAQPGGIKLTLQSQYAGVPSSDVSFKFQVVAINLETGQKINSSYSYPNYVNNQMVELMLPLSIGQYNITISAFNKYGSSEVWRGGALSIPSPTISSLTTIPSTSTPPSSTPSPTRML